MSTWKGDWGWIKDWTRALFPAGISLNGDEDSYPSKIEIHAGTRSHIAPIGREVDCSIYEDADAATQVTTNVQEYLETQDDDRTQVAVRLVAYRLKDGDEVPWTERNALDSSTRVFMRSVAQVTGPVGPTPALAPTSNLAAMARLASALDPPNVGASLAPVEKPNGANGGVSARMDPFPVGDHADGTALSIVGRMINMILSSAERREETMTVERHFLIENLSSSNERMIGVLTEAVKSARSADRDHRAQIDNLMREFRESQVEVAQRDRAAELANTKAQMAHLQSAVDSLQENLKEERKRADKAVAATASGTSIGDKLSDRVADSAGKMLDTVMSGVIDEATRANGNEREDKRGGGEKREERKEEKKPSGGMGGIDIGGLTDMLKNPEMLSMALKLIPAESRKAAIDAMAKGAPEAFKAFAEDLADVYDKIVPDDPDGGAS